MVNRKWGISLFLVVFGLAFLQGCSDYEDGPSISLRSPDSRLTGIWNVVSYGGQPVSGIVYEFREGGVFLATGDPNSTSSTENVPGTWEWVSDDKMAITLSLEGSLPGTYSILQLKNKEMKMEISFGVFSSFLVQMELEKQ